MSQYRKFTPDEDASLLLAWHRGDFSAFENLVWKYLKRVFSLAFYLTGNNESASAATQNVFAAAFVNINSFSSRFHFSNWLLVLTLKEARELLDYSDSVLPEPAGVRTGILDHLAEQLRQLPPELAEVIVLHDVRGDPLERISEIYQLRSDVLAARLFAAHELLAAQIRKGGAPPEQPLPSGEEQIFPHPEIRLSFHAYLDSSLSSEDAEQIRKHLKTCGSCREALTGLEWIVEHLKKLPDIDPPHWLAAAIMQRVKSAPAKPENVQRAPPPVFYLQLGTGLLFIALIGLSAFLLFNDQDNLSRAVSGRAPERKQATSSLQPQQQSKAVDFITSITAPFRSPGRPAEPEGRAALPTAPLPSAAPAEKPAASALSTGTTPAAKVNSEAASSRDSIEKSPELPSEWGESLPASRSQQKKAAPVRGRSGEAAVEMATDDPVAAIKEVENAVTALGGKITGRAYSSGSDMLYTRIDADRFFDLTNRLGKVGRIQEFSPPPDEAEGMVDLIIKWH